MAFRLNLVMVICLVGTSIGDSFNLASAAPQDKWTVVVQDAGVEAMHMTTFYTDKVAIFDRTNLPSNTTILLPNGRCRDNPQDLVSKHDCYAHSVEYDSITNSIRALFVFSDVFCSSGAFLPDGTLQQTGGDKEGERTIRKLGPGPNDDWVETSNYLFVRRWYATNQILPDGTIIVIGGNNNPSYEFVPKKGTAAIPLQILKDAYRGKPEGENNMYPFVHLLPTGNLFIFSNIYSIIFNYKTNTVVKKLPDFGPDPRVYPYSGTSTLLPLSAANKFSTAIIFICGGSTLGAYGGTKGAWTISAATRALDTCGRIDVTAATPKWSVEKMPGPRVMVDGMILPTGEILYVNGMQYGLSGWNTARNPERTPWLYNPTTKVFTKQTPTTIIRPYHSSANVQSDGTVLIAGGNNQSPYTFTGVMFPTELRIEKYYPYYLNAAYDSVRYTLDPAIGVPTAGIKWNTNFKVKFRYPPYPTPPTKVQVSVYAPSFTTHANSMNQRMLILQQVGNITYGGKGTWDVWVTAPPNGNVAPPGYYMLTALNTATTPPIPSAAKWVKFTP
ncbi:hypothetical protein KC19_4G064200 [Ceratodon purpureus]|uniref:Galactose oxidase n=1 Tax=Ceratodon purpureus TaxID=3225 RepID=A0A8T0I7A5_CERPU|nr:hypothetical protein KC19_4G064200 [Ceratodon purpureus]